MNEYDKENIRNKRAENVTIGKLIRFGLYTCWRRRRRRRGGKRRRDVEAGGELYNSSTLEWGSLVRDDTAGILKSGLLVGCWLLRVFQAHSPSARWSFQGLYFRPGRLYALLSSWVACVSEWRGCTCFFLMHLSKFSKINSISY